MSDKNPPRVLIVEDDVLLRRAIVRAFCQEGFVCDVATDGAAGLEMLSAGRFDLMLSDLCMPGMNGHRLIVQALAMDECPAIVVLTGYSQPKIVRDLLTRGVYDVICKPTDYETLALKAKGIVQRRRSDRPAQRLESSAEYAALPSESKKVATQVVQLRQSLTAPPKTFDAFRTASSDAFGTEELVAVLKTMPQAAKEVLTLANSVMFQATEERKRLEDLRFSDPSASLPTQAYAIAAASLAIGLVMGLAGGLIARF